MNNDPVIIGGVGGSGTRLFAESFMSAGLRTMRDLNKPSDAMSCALLFKRPSVFKDMEAGEPFERLWMILESALEGGRPLSKDDRILLKRLALEPRLGHPPAWLKTRARRLKREARQRPMSDRWFIKEPNLHWVAPSALEYRPNLRFVMAVRHGVDMAFSRNQQQVNVWGPTVLEEPGLEINPVASLRYWCLVHRRIADLQKKHPDRVLIVSFDQLCHDPGFVFPHLFEFAEIEPTKELMERASAGVKAPSSIGRHLNEDLSVFDPDDLAFVDSFMATIEMS
jgi:hypothetical protein